MAECAMPKSRIGHLFCILHIWKLQYTPSHRWICQFQKAQDLQSSAFWICYFSRACGCFEVNPVLASQGCQSSSFSIFSGTSVINSFETKIQGIDFHTDDASDPGIQSNSFSPIDDPTSTNANVQHASNLVFVNSGSCSGNSKENQNGLEEG